MKKIYMLLLSVIMAGTSSFAQSGDSGSKVKFGVKAGVNFANMSFSSEGVSVSPESITSFHVGGLVDYSLSEKVSLQPALVLNGKGFKLETGSLDATSNLMYLEIPINVVYKLGGVYLGAGPYAAFGLFGENKLKDSDDSDNNLEEDIKFGSDDESDYKRTDFGVNILAGYQLTNGINFGVGYGLGLSNISNEDAVETKNKVFSISVGYSF